MRSRSRVLVAALAAAASVAGLMVGFGAGSASAAEFSVCEARGLGIDNNAPILSIAQANPPFAPCNSDSVTGVSAKITAFPAALGIGAVVVKAKALKSFTVNGDGSSYAQADITNLTIAAPGLLVTIGALHAQALSYFSEDGVVTVGSSYVTKLKIDGFARNVGSGPVSISLGLGLFLNLNQQQVIDGVITQRAISLTSNHPNNIGRHTEIAEAVAGA